MIKKCLNHRKYLPYTEKEIATSSRKRGQGRGNIKLSAGAVQLMDASKKRHERPDRCREKRTERGNRSPDMLG